MYRVAICDDEEIICSQIENIILSYGKSISERIEVEVYYSGEELYRFLLDGISYDMIFLDIELKGLNGIEVGERIRNQLKNENVHIVYFSGKESYAMELFKIRPMDFLVKPIDIKKVRSVIKKGMELSNNICPCFYYKQGHNTKKKPIRDVIYFESMDRQVKMVTVEEEIIFYGSLSEIFTQVERFNFFYIHKSYVVNYNHVIEFSYEQLYMSNRSALPISQARRKNVREIQLKYEREGW